MKRRGNTLVATLAVVAIILVMMIAFFKGSGAFGGGAAQPAPRKDGLGNSIPGAVKYKARDEECRSNLDQVRQFIMLAQNQSTDEKVASLKETGAPSSILSCPIGKEPYLFDPQTLKVSCPHPGHERL